MQVHKLTVMVIDHDRLGDRGVVENLENGRFPNRCISPDVMAIESVDIGEWRDDHPLNQGGKEQPAKEFKRLFAEQPVPRVLRIDETTAARVDVTQAMKDEVFERVLKYYEKYRCWSGESVMQNDDPQIYASPTLAEIVDDVIKPTIQDVS